MIKFSTPDICDANSDQIRVLDPIMKSFGGKKAFFGEVVTVKCHEDNSLVKEQAEKSGRGKVLVVDGGGSLRRALLGDNIAKTAEKNGWQGMIIFGAVRDVEILATLDFGVQALAANPLKTVKRGVGDLNIPVRFGGITIVPGEHIYADENGVVVSSQCLI